METGAHPPLKDIRVLDFTVMLAGPYATMMLADCGAEVLKIERPGTGDNTRTIGPFSAKDVERQAGGFFLSIGRNKKSVTIDLKHPKGIELAKELVKKSDVVVENFRPGVMDRLGLGYGDLKEINPRIVYTSISGFGHTGPYKDRPSFDLIAQAIRIKRWMIRTGWMSPPIIYSLNYYGGSLVLETKSSITVNIRIVNNCIAVLKPRPISAVIGDRTAPDGDIIAIVDM